MELPITGHCLCGSIKYEATAQPRRSGFCYCRPCQIKSGSGHLAYIAVDINAVTVIGTVKWYQAIGDSGKPKHHGFCAECGSVLFGKPQHWPHVLVIYAGSLDNPAEFNPEVNVWQHDLQPWDCIDHNLKSFDKNPS